MTGLCTIGTEPTGDPNERIFLTDGIFCTILGVEHPLCRLIDRVWYVTAQVLDFANPSDAPIDASKFWWSWARRFANQTIQDAATIGIKAADLCQFEPRITGDPVTYTDLVSFLLGQDDAILVKVFELWRFRVWFDFCQCRANRVPVLPDDLSPPVPTVPGLPYCGGVVAGPPPSAIAGCLEPLAEYLQEVATANAIEQANFSDQAAAKITQEPYQVGPPEILEIGNLAYSGTVGRGWKVLANVAPPTAPCSDTFPFYLLPNSAQRQRAFCPDPAGDINVAVLFQYGPTDQLANFEVAETTLEPLGNYPPIAAGTVLSIRDGVQFSPFAGACWYFLVRPKLPACPPTGGRFGAWNDPGGDDLNDDRAICLDVPALCSYRVPDCCGGATVLMDADNQIALVRAFGFEISQGENQ